MYYASLRVQQDVLVLVLHRPEEACGWLMCFVEMPKVKPAYHKGELSDASGVVINACGYTFYINAEVFGWRQMRACWKASVSCVGIGWVKSFLHTVARSTSHPTNILQSCTELNSCYEHSALLCIAAINMTTDHLAPGKGMTPNSP